MKGLHRAITIISVFLALIALVVVADYNNWLSNWGHDVSNYNFDLLSIVIGNSVVILLFVITFVLLDRRNIQKEENKRKVALIMLKSIYNHCAEIIEKFDDHNFLVDVMHPNFMEKTSTIEAKKQHFTRLPFSENDETILAFSQDGILHGEEIETYIRIKKVFIEYIGSFWINASPLEMACISFQKDEFLKQIKAAIEKIEEEMSNDYHRKTL